LTCIKATSPISFNLKLLSVSELAPVLGILGLGYKLLVNDLTKFAALLLGVSVVVFLMIEMTLLFSGSLYRASATVIERAKIWAIDPAVQIAANTRPLRRWCRPWRRWASRDCRNRYSDKCRGADSHGPWSGGRRA
jgi:hypothetical protein